MAVEYRLMEAFGIQFTAATPSTGWAEWPPPAMWYPEALVSRLRTNRAPESVGIELTAINHSTGDPSTPIQRLTMEGLLVLQATGSQPLDAEKFRLAYLRLRSDPKLRPMVDAGRSTVAEDARAVHELANLCGALAEAVEATETLLPGTCPACEHLEPR